jgi:hypothetical protein
MKQSWHDLSINDVIEITKIQNNHLTNDFQKTIAILSILTSIDEDELLDMPIGEFEELAAVIKFISSDIPKPKNNVKMIMIGGEEYHPVPGNKLTTGDVVSINILKAEFESDEMMLALNILPYVLRKKDADGKFVKIRDAETHKELVALFKKSVSIVDLHQIINFFLNTNKASVNVTTSSSSKK